MSNVNCQLLIMEENHGIKRQGSGIGRAVARDLNEAGVKLVLTGRRKDRLSVLRDELSHAAIFRCDISEPEMPESLLKTALDSFGRCDIVFNNAGVITVGSIDEINVEDICYMVRVNVEAAFRMAYVAVKHFKSTGSGFLGSLGCWYTGTRSWGPLRSTPAPWPGMK